jgi:hypothetical protein
MHFNNQSLQTRLHQMTESFPSLSSLSAKLLFRFSCSSVPLGSPTITANNQKHAAVQAARDIPILNSGESSNTHISRDMEYAAGIRVRAEAYIKWRLNEMKGSKVWTIRDRREDVRLLQPIKWHG